MAKPMSSSVLIGQGLHGVRPFWAGFRPGQESLPTPRVSGPIKKEFERLGKPRNWNSEREDFALRNEPPETADEQWCAVASEPRAASAMVPWIVIEGI